jgi:AraC family transcriptional regulator, regulatory protein of adaptative response / methylated-DNA-[protein]-cysteine methyltransferase
MNIYWANAETCLGTILVVATTKGICRLAFDEDIEDVFLHYSNATIMEADAQFETWMKAAAYAVDNPQNMPEVPFDMCDGTAFQQKVWRALLEIPAGETRSYADIANAIGHPRAMRAVGSANGANRISVIIPCHRVIRSDGALGGYGGTPERKRELLRREGAQWKE